jgi:MspA
MFKPVRVGAIAVALLIVGGGVAAADPVPSVNQHVETADGYIMTASLGGLPGETTATINPAANMAATAYSREGFVSGLATETVTPIHGKVSVPVTDAKLRLWVQFGCQIDVRGGSVLGGNMSNALSLPFNIADILAPTAIGAAPEPSDSFNPTLAVNVKPGNIFRAQLAEKEVKGPATELHIAVRDTEVKVDGCGGPVSVRLIATAEIITNTSDDWVNAYSDIVQL